MKKIKNILFTILVGVLSFIGMYTNVFADAPKTFKTKEPVLLTDYIEGAPKVHLKALESGILVYCQNEPLVYQGGYTMKINKKVDDGFIYILENKPNTGDSNKDYYAMQIAIWWYEDILNNNNVNIPASVKTSILQKVNTDKYIRIIYNLVNGAKKYSQNKNFSVSFNSENTNFTLDGDYYVSEKIKIKYVGKLGEVVFENAPKGLEVIDKELIEGTYTFKVRIPVASLEKGKTTTIKVSTTSTGEIKKVYNYTFSEDFQTVIYGEVFSDKVEKKAEKTLSITTEPEKVEIKEYEVNISKTDITGGKEIPGATLNVKGDNDTNITWISTTESHKIVLKPGVYVLTENIAPKGYILSKESIEFKLTEDGTLYEKNNEGIYEKVTVIKMVNEVRPQINISKLNGKTNEYVTGATLVIENLKGEVISTFITGNESTYVSLEEGEYVLKETVAPAGYILNNNGIYFKVAEDGTLYIKNSNGEYEKSNGIIIYNEPVEVVIPDVPKTGLSSTITYVVGTIALLSGAMILFKNEKKC